MTDSPTKHIKCFYKFPKNKKGDFSFIKDIKERTILKIDYNAFDLLYEIHYIDGWELLRFNDYLGSFRMNHRSNMVTSLRNIRKINDNCPWEGITCNIWDTPPGRDWRLVYTLMYQSHTEESYNRNIRNLSLIANYGWDFFVKRYPLF